MTRRPLKTTKVEGRTSITGPDILTWLRQVVISRVEVFFVIVSNVTLDCFLSKVHMVDLGISEVHYLILRKIYRFY